MRLLPLVAGALSAPFLLLAPAAPLCAQHVLITEHAGKAVIVRGADGLRPIIEENGRRMAINGHRLGLTEVEEFQPVFVSVRKAEVTTSYLTVGNSAEINNELHYRAEFESAFALDNVFVVLDLRGERAGRMLFLYGIGRLDPRVPQPISVTVPLSFAFGSGRYYCHVFVDGLEVLHSDIPMEQREAALDRMIAKRTEGVKERALKLFVGPAPEYPVRLRKASIAGEAVVAMRVTATGRTQDIVLRSATDPAFGEAAVAAVRLWRFLPMVRNGQPVETAAQVPFAFAPPAKGGK